MSRVEVLCLNISVPLNTAASILTLCTRVKTLNLRFPCHLFGRNPILPPLENLQRIKALYMDLSSIFNSQAIYLPDISIFRRIMHLHLTNAWATWYPTANSIGPDQLPQITHFSLFLSTIRTLPGLLKKIVDRKNLAVLVLWKRFLTNNGAAVRFLVDSGINDRRVLLLEQQLFRSHTLDGGFWEAAEQAVKQREGTDSEGSF